MKVVLLLAFVLGVIGASIQAVAAPVAIAAGEGVVITLHDDACAVAGVTNLPYRATWLERGVTTEGCFGFTGGIAAFFWSDKTVTIFPLREFKRVSHT